MKHRIPLVGLAFLILCSLTLGLYRPHVANAEEIGTWKDPTTIVYKGTKFTNVTTSGNPDFEINGAACSSQTITDFTSNNTASLYNQTKQTVTGTRSGGTSTVCKKGSKITDLGFEVVRDTVAYGDTANSVIYNGKTYIFGRTDGSYNVYYLDGKSDLSKDCVDTIKMDPGTGGVFIQNSFTGARFRSCSPTYPYYPGISLAIANPNTANVFYTFKDQTTILSSDGKDSYILSNDKYIKKTSGVCPDDIVIPAGTSLTAAVITGSLTQYNAATSGGGRGGGTVTTQCTVKSGYPQSIKIANTNKAATTPPSQNNQISATPSDSCESLNSALTWIVCPVIRLIDGAVSSLDTNINSQLRSPDYGQAGVNNNNLKTAWGRIRNIALIILIPIMLVMVIGTAIGVGGLDTYTVKKAMPRLLIAILFISISWYITVFLVNFTNVVAQGILGLITQPFGIANKSLVDFMNVSGGLTTSGLAGVGALLLLGRVDLAIAFSAVGMAAIALLGAFLVLVIRQILILALIMLAPLAILSWIFPSNNDLWKLWWGTFSKLLMMYPLILILIGAGKIGASIIPAQQRGDGPFTQLLILFAYIIPYFLIPATFKFAGGVLANLAGVINDRSRGLFDRQRKFRQEHSAELKKRSSAGFRFNPNNPLINRMSKSNNKLIRRLNPNRLGEWSASPYKAAAYYGRNKAWNPLAAKGRKIASEVEHEQFEQSAKLFQQLNSAIGSNDKAYRALFGGYDGFSQSTQAKLRAAGYVPGRALTSEKDLNNVANILASSGSHTEIEAASALRRAAPVIGNKYRDNELNYSSVAAAAAIGLGAHGFHVNDDMPTMFKAIRRETGNAEFADSALVQVELAGASSNPFLAAGYGHQYDSNYVDPETGEIGRVLSAKEAGRDLAAIERLPAGAIAAAKGGAIKDQADTFAFILDSADPSEDLQREKISVAQGRAEQARAAVRADVTRGMTEQQIAAAGTAIDDEVDQDPRVVSARRAADSEIAAITAPSKGAQAESFKKQEIERLKAEAKAKIPGVSDEDAEKIAAERFGSDPKYHDVARLAQAHKMGDAFKSTMLFSAASRFSQAPVDTKTQVMAIIDANPDLKREFEMFEGKAASDPEIMAMIQASNAGMQAAQAAGVAAQQNLFAPQNPNRPNNPFTQR